MLTLKEVDKIVRRNLDCLDPTKYKIDRQEWGDDVKYTLYKGNEFLGTFRVGLDEYGKVQYGSIHCSDKPELSREWDFVWQEMIAVMVQRAEEEKAEVQEQPVVVDAERGRDFLPRPGSTAEFYRQWQVEQEKKNLREIIVLRQKANELTQNQQTEPPNTIDTGAGQDVPPSKPVKKRKILFEGIFPTTPKIFLGILHGFWLDCASSLEGTAISGMKFNFAPFNEHFSRIYIQLGPSNLEIIANIDIRRLNDGLIKIIIPSTEGDVTFFRGKLWDEISSMTDQFLLDFAIHLEKLYSRNKETKDAQEPTANANRWEKMGKKTQENFSRAWKIYRKMCRDYEKDILDSASQKPKPTVQDFRVRVIKEMHWAVGEKRLRTVISYGEAGLIK